MTERRLANGYVLTDAEVERRAREWEDGTWRGHLERTRVGRPSLSDGEETTTVSFRVPSSKVIDFERKAKAAGETKSQAYRRAMDLYLQA